MRFLAGHTGIEQVTLSNNAAYLASWIRALKGDARLVIQAGAAAQKAIDYILNRQTETAQDGGMRLGRVSASIGPAALPKRRISGNAVRPNRRRNQENGHCNYPSPNIEMGKAGQSSADPPTESGKPNARVSDSRVRLNE